MPYTDPCKTIREELRRRHGWTSRQVSVRNDRGSIRCTIKAPGVQLAAVKEIASQHEVIHRCERTGEILSGGNTYVSVSFDWELTHLLDKAISAWAETIPADGTTFQPFPDFPEISVWRHDRYDFRCEDNPDAMPKVCHGSNTIGTVLACMLLERGISSFAPPAAPARTLHSEPSTPPPGAGQFDSGTTDTATRSEEVLSELGFGEDLTRENAIHEPKDEACRLDAAGDCTLCGLHHGTPCEICGGRAYHRRGCHGSGEAVLASLVGTEVLLDDPRGTGRVRGRIRHFDLGALQVDIFGAESVWRSAFDLEPAPPLEVPIGAPVVFTPWTSEGPNTPTPGYVSDLRGFAMVVQSLGEQAFQTLRFPASLIEVTTKSTCAECQGGGWLVVKGEGRVTACDCCGVYDDETAVAAAIAFASSRGVSLASLFAS